MNTPCNIGNKHSAISSHYKKTVIAYILKNNYNYTKALLYCVSLYFFRFRKILELRNGGLL